VTGEVTITKTDRRVLRSRVDGDYVLIAESESWERPVPGKRRKWSVDKVAVTLEELKKIAQIYLEEKGWE
jgi:hypothetical protein